MTAEKANPSDTLTLAQRFHRSPDDESVWYTGTSNKGKPLPPAWVCSRAVAYFVMAQRHDHKELVYVLHFLSLDGRMREIAIKPAELAHRATIQRLLNEGLRVTTVANAGALFAEFVMATAVECDASRLESQ